MYGKFGMLEKKGDQRKAQTRFTISGKGGNQARGLCMQRFIFVLSAEYEINAKHTQGIC